MSRQTMRRGWLPILALAGLALVAGCGDDPSPTGAPGDVEEQIDMNDPTGGFQATDEAPAFGDADLLTEAATESEYEDPVGDDPVFDDLAGRPSTKIFAVSLYWGMLESGGSPDGSADGEDGDLYDWSGGVEVSSGALMVRTLISFEAEDRLLLPRPDRRTVTWISHTGIGMDGIRLLAYQWPHDANSEPDTLWLTTPLFSRAFSFDELADLDQVFDIDEAGNQVRIQAFLTEPTAQVHGFLRGRWTAIAEGDSVGDFAGLWVGDRGRLSGYFRGHYGLDDAGKQVFFGKYIDVFGRFQGFLRGEYTVQENGPDGTPAGSFFGQWLDEDHSRIGSLRGRYRSAPGERPGFLSGRWCLGCR